MKLFSDQVPWLPMDAPGRGSGRHGGPNPRGSPIPSIDPAAPRPDVPRLSMRMQPRLLLVTLSLVIGGFVSARPSHHAPPAPDSADWIAEPSDNICGIADLRKLSNPARVDYDSLFESTPEMKELRRDRIDPGSARGKQLRRAANELITKAAEMVRRARGHCGVWKAIRHRDGRAIPDVTEEVRARF